MEVIKKIWTWLDGNKTILCLGSATVLDKLIEFQILMQSNITDFVSWLLLALGGGALWQHIKSGYFKLPNKTDVQQ